MYCVPEVLVHDSSTVIYLSSPLDKCQSKRFPLMVSGNAEAESRGQAGVGIALSSRAERWLLDWIPVNSRVYAVRLNTSVGHTSSTSHVSKKRRRSHNSDETPSSAEKSAPRAKIVKCVPTTPTVEEKNVHKRKRPFEHEEQSKTESSQSEGQTPADKKRLRVADVPTTESESATALNSRTLYIRKLPRNTTLDQIKVLCPTSITARIQSKKFANRRKHAFVEFKSEEVARAALKSISGKLVADRPIEVELCSERGLSRRSSADEIGQIDISRLHWTAPQQRQLQEFSTTVLHVSCIPRSATTDEIRDLFPSAASFDIIMNPKQKGIG
ncbi:uncharacterized protein DEA37_0005348 [Paragonimus westermani]|uniref:RRM domain-containing protein n=1 Tax=Paragonimus westermani TaxID=34504 RepID=A0A5J4NGS7_9TREM|nr:uncharacterized protein DEA37_0005348 [Paragonimus westermani]